MSSLLTKFSKARHQQVHTCSSNAIRATPLQYYDGYIRLDNRTMPANDKHARLKH
jgi:hypothetical protein